MLDKTVIKNNRKFLVSCPDTFLVDLFIKECCLAYTEYELKRCYDTQTFVETLNRGSLFDSNKKIVALMCLSDDNIQEVEALLEYETEDIILLIEGPVLSKNKIYSKIKGSFTYQKPEKLSDRECRNWLHTYMLTEELKFITEAPALIIKKCGTELRFLANEVKKLKLLGKDITEDLCADVISDFNEANFYDFADHFGHKRILPCLQELDKIEESKYAQLLYFMVGHLEKLYKVSVFREQKKSSEEIADLMGLPKFIITTKFYTSITIFNKIKLLKVLDLLNELDIKLRLTKYDNKVVFESYILKMLKL
jgi:DNA polymerase III delta subunit